jgi:hypothetical protein
MTREKIIWLKEMKTKILTNYLPEEHNLERMTEILIHAIPFQYSTTDILGRSDQDSDCCCVCSCLKTSRNAATNQRKECSRKPLHATTMNYSHG